MDISHVYRYRPPHRALTVVGAVLCLAAFISRGRAAEAVDFNRDIRHILSENCFKCHGPDAKDRKGGQPKLRLDSQAGSRVDLGGHQAIVPGQPDKSELVRRITTDDPDDKMPPPSSGKTLSKTDIALLQSWIKQGAVYARHWAYVKPVRPALPHPRLAFRAKNAIDLFILAHLEKEGLSPSPEADRHTLIRRVSLDLTGLPPSLEDVRQFVNDQRPGAYERLVDRLLARETFGEHWARLWLDQARYADSAGYADDPPRTIWAYRDYVIRALNKNTPFDQFTIEQIAGDLLPEPTDEDLVATGFHRNTPTNNEGGTDDEEFRNVAVVDRVNTTMAVWMGTTMGCAQCHNHKYDPITQKEYFRLFAILNNTADADRNDESPVLSIYTSAQKKQKQEWTGEITRLQQITRTITPELAKDQAVWEKDFDRELNWELLNPAQVKSKSAAAISRAPKGEIIVERGGKTDVYTVEVPVATNSTLAALRLDTLPDDGLPAGGPGYAKGNFLISRVLASVTPPGRTQLSGRYLRIELPGKQKILSLAEVQVFHGLENIALEGVATQSSTAFDGDAKLAIDGNTNGDFAGAKSTTHTDSSTSPWWEVDLKSSQPVDRVVLWNRTDGDLQDRLKGFKLLLLDEKRETVWEQEGVDAPKPSAEFAVDGARNIPFTAAYVDYPADDFDGGSFLGTDNNRDGGWSVAPQFGRAHSLTLVPASPVEVPANSTLTLTIEQLSKRDYATLGRFRFAATTDPRAADHTRVPPSLKAILKTPRDQRKDADQTELTKYYLTVAPALAEERAELDSFKKQLREMKPYTTVPVFRELTGDKRRKTHLQHRGNFLDIGEEVTEGLPSAFSPPPAGVTPNRLVLARWLVDTNNPLTARVAVNRLWEAIFGIGIVRTGEDFGTQGEAPSNPELLDWMATEFMEKKWDRKYLLKLMVTSAAYRQSSRVTPEQEARDPDNRWLARGPRFRLSAEMIRDQALFVGGLLSSKMYGPPVKPPQPKLGLSAAFGSATDWETSSGEDRYRRALYTMWRRSNPYPSMSAFDAPNREVCTVRRERSNTPLQALVTLNDPVYIEAARGLARRMTNAGKTPAERASEGFLLCLCRPPGNSELEDILDLYQKTSQRFVANSDKARKLTGEPETASAGDVADLAAWTVVGNVLLNLDETLMKP